MLTPEQTAFQMQQKHGKKEAIERVNSSILTFKDAEEPEYQMKLVFWCNVLEAFEYV